MEQMDQQRRPVTIRFRFNEATGQIEEFLIDDGDRTASEAYHNKIARAIAGELFKNPVIEDAGLDATTEPEATPAPTAEAGKQQA
jgi:hypothetical protein